MLDVCACRYFIKKQLQADYPQTVVAQDGKPRGGPMVVDLGLRGEIIRSVSYYSCAWQVITYVPLVTKQYDLVSA